MDERGRRLLGILRWIVPLVSVVIVVALVDWRALSERLGRFDPRFVALFLALSVPFYALCALRWTFTARRLEVPLGFGRAMAEYYVSTLLNQVLPLGIAGDVVRATRHRARLGEGSTGRVARAVILERLSGVMVLVLVAAVAMVALVARAGASLGPVAGYLSVLGGVVLAIVGVLFWASRVRRGLGSDIRAALLGRGALVVQLALSSAALFVLLLMFLCAGRAAGAAIDFASVVRTVPIVLVAVTIPWPFAGWGTREGLTAALLPLVGPSPADGVAASIAFGLLSLVAAAPGLVPLVLRRRRA